MKILFHRKGFANNSSSSHSLVFAEDAKEAQSIANRSCQYEESTEFGWARFSCREPEHKFRYLISCIYNRFQIDEEVEDDELLSIGKVEILHNLKDTLELNVPDEYWNRYEQDLKEYSEPSVDHQSLIFFPKDQANKEYFHTGFAKDFIQYIIDHDNVLFVGGNDNSDIDQYQSPLQNDLIKTYNYLQSYCDEMLCSYDPKQNAYTLYKVTKNYSSKPGRPAQDVEMLVVSFANI